MKNDLPAIFMSLVACIAVSCTRVETTPKPVPQETFEPEQFTDRGEVADDESFEEQEPPPKKQVVNSLVFPGTPTPRKSFNGSYSLESSSNEGITLRDYFAAHAPQRPGTQGEQLKGYSTEAEARWRWDYADEMLRQR